MSSIRLGYYEKAPQSEGDIAYLQVRHIDVNADRVEKVDTFIDNSAGLEAHLLKYGDVLFAAKGTRNFAWSYSESIGNAIASTAFLVIRSDLGKMMPEFLAIILNHPNQQAKFQQMVSGSSMPSIRKQDMEELTIPFPDLDLQKKIVDLHKSLIEERALMNALLNEKEKLVQSVIKEIINK